MLSAVGRLEWFAAQALVIGDECAAGKPDPAPYLEAMRQLGVTAAECMAFEDSPSGATAAVAAGVRTVGLTTTQPARALAAAGCDLLIDDFNSEELWLWFEPGDAGRWSPALRPSLVG